MENNKPYVNINFLPLVTIATIIVISIVAASLWNQVRTQTKLSKIQTHSEAIYKAHQNEFADVIKTNIKTNYESFLDKINFPEKGIYEVSILTKDSSGNYMFHNRWDEGSLSTDVTDKLNSLLSNEHSVSTTENILSTNQYGDSLYVFTPIKNTNGSDVLGFVVVGVRRDQNI